MFTSELTAADEGQPAHPICPGETREAIVLLECLQQQNTIRLRTALAFLLDSSIIS